jgi:hypothetical protein
MEYKKSLKRKYCSLCATEVEIQVIDPASLHDGVKTDFEKFLESEEDLSCEEENPNIRISDLVSYLEDFKNKRGDLKLCVADRYSLFTLSNDNLNFEVVNKTNYNFSIGLEEDDYLSLKIE